MTSSRSWPTPSLERARPCWPSMCRRWPPRSACPVLLLLGERSPTWAHDITVETQAAIPVSELVVLPDVGHEAIDATPHRLVRELDRFLLEATGGNA